MDRGASCSSTPGQVTAEEVRDIFATFFGKNHRLIAHVADRLERLEATVRQLPGLRFWGGSLLVLFDASVSSGEPRAAELSEAPQQARAHAAEVGGRCGRNSKGGASARLRVGGRKGRG